MKKQTREYMAQFHMTAPGDGVVVGLSGGADSVCLLHLLWCLKEGLGIELRSVHVHHGLRDAEADRDAAFAAEFSGSLGIPFREVRIDAAAEAAQAGISVEEAGRLARYRILEEEAASWEQERRPFPVHIAVAHHGDDNAETILHHLFRGSGLKGLGGIPPVRGRVIRPLLPASRAQILEYVTKERLEWVEDSSNGQNEYTRNRIRNELLPLITEAVNPQAVQNILRAGERIGQADRYFEKKADEWLEPHGDTGSAQRQEYRLDAAALCGQEDILKGYIIRRALERMSCPLKDITARHIEDIIALCGKETGKYVMLPHGIRAAMEYGKLRLIHDTGSRLPEQPAGLPVWSSPEILSGCPEKQSGQTPENPLHPLKTRVFPCKNPVGFPKNQYTKWFDYDRIKGTLSVRTRRPGDYIMLPGGGKKTVKAYMIDEKVPREQRDRLLLLAEDSHVLWIVGRRISEYYKVTEDTEVILEVHLDGGNDNGR